MIMLKAEWILHFEKYRFLQRLLGSPSGRAGTPLGVTERVLQHPLRPFGAPLPRGEARAL